MGQEKGRNQWKSHKFLNFDDMIHTRAGMYFASLDSMWSKYKQDIKFR